MSYNTSIPQATSKRTVSQKQILINFQSIFQAFANNHSPLGLGTQGKHTVLILRTQIADPATSSSQTAIYQKLVAGVPNWFYRPASNGTPIQMSYPSIDVTTSNANYTFLAGPFVVYTGKISNPTNGQLVTLTPSTTIRYVGLGVNNFTGVGVITQGVAATDIVGNTFKIRFQAGSVSRDVYYLAIGN